MNINELNKLIGSGRINSTSTLEGLNARNNGDQIIDFCGDEIDGLNKFFKDNGYRLQKIDIDGLVSYYKCLSDDRQEIYMEYDAQNDESAIALNYELLKQY